VERDNEAANRYEIEVTPEMIEAGLTAYCAWYKSSEGDSGPIDNMLSSVFKAMASVRTIQISCILPSIDDIHHPIRSL
jgi:hypothetical protein